MLMPAVTVRMTMRQLVSRRGTHIDHFDIKHQRPTGQRMVGIDIHGFQT
jgi:hypothetical protein